MRVGSNQDSDRLIISGVLDLHDAPHAGGGTGDVMKVFQRGVVSKISYVDGAFIEDGTSYNVLGAIFDLGFLVPAFDDSYVRHQIGHDVIMGGGRDQRHSMSPYYSLGDIRKRSRQGSIEV